MYQLSQLGSANARTASVWGYIYDNDKDRLEHDLDSVSSETNNTVLENARGSPQSIHRGLNNWIALATKGKPGAESKANGVSNSYDIEAVSHIMADQYAPRDPNEIQGRRRPVKSRSESRLHEQARSQIPETVLRPVRYQSQLSRKASQLAGLNNSYSGTSEASVNQRDDPGPQFTKQLSQSPAHYTLDGATSQPGTPQYHDTGLSIHTTIPSPFELGPNTDTDSPTLPSIEGLESKSRPYLRTICQFPSRDEARYPTLTELVADVNENRVSMSIYSVSSTDNDVLTISPQASPPSSKSNGAAQASDQSTHKTNVLPAVPRKSPERNPYSCNEVVNITANSIVSPPLFTSANDSRPSRFTPVWSPSLMQSGPSARQSTIHTVARSKYSSPTWQNRGLFRHESASSPSSLRNTPEEKLSSKASIRKSIRLETCEYKGATGGSSLDVRKRTVLGKRQSQRQRSPSEDSSGQCVAAKPKHARFDLSQFKILSTETTKQLEQNLGLCKVREAEARSLYSSLSARRKEMQCNLDSLPTLSIPSMVAVTEIARLAKCVTDIDDAILNAGKDIEESLREHADVERRLLEHTVALAMKGTQSAPQGIMRQDLFTPPPSPECHELDDQATKHREEVTSAAYTEAAVASLLASIETELHALQTRRI